MTWTQGATEPGSSGAALIDMESRQVVGVLTGGTTTCDVFSGADYFGKLSVVRCVPSPEVARPPVGFCMHACMHAWSLMAGCGLTGHGQHSLVYR